MPKVGGRSVTKLSSPIRVVCIAVAAALAVVGTAQAQPVTQAKVLDLLAQAQAGVTGAIPPQTGQPATTAPSQVVDITQDEAVAKALKMNIELSVERLNPQLQDLALKAAFGAYVPTIGGTLGERSQTTRPGSVIGGGTVVNNTTTTFNATLTQGIPWTGGTANVNWGNSRQGTDNSLTTLNPRFDTSIQAALVQPLWRNRAIDANRQTLLTTEINRRIADISLRAATVNTVANTRNAYWDLVYAIQAVESAKTSLALAQKLVEDNKIRVEIGTLAPLDIVSAQAEAASRQQTLVANEANRRTAELTFKRLIVSGTDDPIWNVTLNPVDRPATDVAEKIDLEAALRTALENRTDVVTARRNLDISNIGLKYSRNQTKPGVDLTASYTTAGAGGTTVLNGVPVTPGGYWDALGQAGNVNLPTWNAQVVVSYPIGTSSADATLARAKVQYQQSLAQLRALELTVATDLTNQALTVTSAFEQVQAAAASRELSQKRLEAEQSKFEVGMSYNYNVVLAQRDFTDAQNSELRAILNYRKALVDFQRKQETAAR
jgi:outer membrane protein TolC